MGFGGARRLRVCSRLRGCHVLGGQWRRSPTALGWGALDRRCCPLAVRPSVPGVAAPEGWTWVRPWLTGSASGVEDPAHDSLGSLLFLARAAGTLCLDWGPWAAPAPGWDCYLVLPPAWDSCVSSTVSDGNGPNATAGARVCPTPWTVRRLQIVDAR